MKTKPTDEMLNDLMKANHLCEYMKSNEEYLVSGSLSDKLEKLLDRKGIDKKDAIAASDLNAIYAYQIFSGDRTPSRDKLLQLCFGMGLDVDETQKLLKESGYAPLYAKDKRDCVIMFMMNKRENVISVNLELEENGLAPLGDKNKH